MTGATSLLRDFDTAIDDLKRECLGRFEAGGAVAAAEFATFTALAGAIARGLAEWRTLTAASELATSIDLHRAGVLVIESVFDEVLAPTAWRVLTAAFALTELDA